MWESLLVALEITGKGMAGIFAASLVIMLAVMVMGRIGNKSGKKDSEKT